MKIWMGVLPYRHVNICRGEGSCNPWSLMGMILLTPPQFSAVFHVGTSKRPQAYQSPQIDCFSIRQIYNVNRRLPARAGAEVSKIGHGYRKAMAYRKVFAMQKRWSVEVVRCITEWANGCWDAKEMTWKNLCTLEWMNQWVEEPMNQGIKQSVNYAMKQRRIND
jgi:hypothetical protein